MAEQPTPEELEQQLREQKEASLKLQQQVETMKLQNKLEAEQLQQQQWELALEQLRQSWAAMNQQHEENMERIRKAGNGPSQPLSDQAVAWITAQLGRANLTEQDQDKDRRVMRMEQLQKQKEELQRQIEDIAKGEEDSAQEYPPSLRDLLSGCNKPRSEQEILLEQVRTTLGPKEAERDPNKALLRALLMAQNKTTGQGGTSTLKPDLFNKLMGDREFSMAEWLASLNKQEEGESDIGRLLNRVDDDLDCRGECRHSKKSGMLDKSTRNIRHKEVWPQKNLGEDWAEEEIEFKQLRFKHLVAGKPKP